MKCVLGKFRACNLFFLLLIVLALLVTVSDVQAAASDAVIMYRGRPAGSWVGVTRDAIHKSFGRQYGDSEETDDEYFYDYYGENIDITFVYNQYSPDSSRVFCKEVSIEPSLASVNNRALNDKNYDGLVKIFGQPISKRFVPERFTEDAPEAEPAYYEVKFALSEKNGKNLVLLVWLDDLEKDTAARIRLQRK